MGRLKILSRVSCPTCKVEFQPARREQQFCSRLCGFKARSERAIQYHQGKLEKRCCSCGDVKPMQCFSKNMATMDGYQSSCKPCCKKQQQERLVRVHSDHKRLALYRQTSRKAQDNVRAKLFAAQSTASVDEWLHHMSHGKTTRLRKYSSDREMRYRHNEISRARYKNDLEFRENAKAYQKSRHKQFPWIMLTRKHRRDARLAGVVDDGTVSSDVMKVLWLNAKICLYCGRDLTDFNKSVEHMHPMSKGGAHTIGNVVIVCASCNEWKRQKWFDEWLELINEPFRSMAHDRFIVQFSGSCPASDYSG